MSQIQRAYRQLPSAEPAEFPPGPTNGSNLGPKLGSKLERVELHLRWINTLSDEDICAYPYGPSEGTAVLLEAMFYNVGAELFRKIRKIGLEVTFMMLN